MMSYAYTYMFEFFNLTAFIMQAEYTYVSTSKYDI